ncbi:olfactory receptor 2K2-like [Lepisosteus oculatus]|uniref:Olfactory receptor n=1 Tax=Lepisosteus oculatus TaxID=7918 RepID=W5NLQ1_LEPOC|nr:PREDICTED: olfactory receptor 2K2-like [Lepisosteus oculatus]
MEDLSLTGTFLLTLFGEIENVRFAYFALALFVYLSIIVINLTLTLLIFLEKNLHEPMYIFLCGLSVNSLYGTAGFFPRFLADLLSDTQTITRAACFTQAFIIYSYAISEFSMLTVMAYDRYVAITEPLQYNIIMTPRHISVLMAVAWLYPVFCMGLIIMFSARLPLCGNQIERLYCSNWSIVKLSCVNTTLNNAVGFVISCISSVLPLCFILYSYIKILIVCQKSSKEFKNKALQTCLPHLISLVNYSITVLSEVILNRFETKEMLKIVPVILSLEFLIIPPLLNPLIYGLNLPEIRKRIILLFRNKKILIQ